MTRYELWTMPGKRLLDGYKNAVRALPKESAEKAVEVLESEILRRLKMLEQMAEEDET